jgi:uncharacterized protein (DUF58 family)
MKLGRLSVHSPVFPYLVFLALLYLTGFYFGDIFLLFFYTAFIIPIVAVFHLLFTAARLRFSQEFSTAHPLKGEEVKYTINVSLESFIPGSKVSIHFKRGNTYPPDRMKSIHYYPKPHCALKKTLSITCPFRGIYTVGVENIEVSDELGWFTYSRPLWHRTFYIYPRIIKLNHPVIDQAGDISQSAGEVPGAREDVTLFRGLREYNVRENIRNIYWKKFFQTGKPFIKTYDKSAWPGVTIFVDTRRTADPEYQVLKTEDCTVEILVSITEYCIRKNIPVYIRAGGWISKGLSTGSVTSFTHFHESTISLFFDSTGPASVSPSGYLKMGREAGTIPTGTVLLITHILDPDSAAFLSSTGEYGLDIYSIFNVTGMDQSERLRVSSFAVGKNEGPPRVFTVNDTESIRDDLDWSV